MTVIAALPCGTFGCDVHVLIGFAIVALWFVFFAWGVGAFVARREPNAWYWRLLAVLQVLLVLQLAVGGVLFAFGHRAGSVLHYLYGAVFPVLVLGVAHVLARRLDDEGDAWKVFAVAAFFVFGLTLRALTTGLGIG